LDGGVLQSSEQNPDLLQIVVSSAQTEAGRDVEQESFTLEEIRKSSCTRRRGKIDEVRLNPLFLQQGKFT
jgi:hypothetical protein